MNKCKSSIKIAIYIINIKTNITMSENQNLYIIYKLSLKLFNDYCCKNHF